MMKLILCGASAFALVATAVAADPAAAQASEAGMQTPTQTTPDYSAHPAGVVAPMTAADVATKDDARKLAEAEFKRADADVNGALDKAEFSSLAAAADTPASGAKPASIDAAFAKIAKGDARITETELVDARAKSFEQADANRDLMLDEKESQKFASLVGVTAQGGVKLQ